MTVLTETAWGGWALDRHTAEELNAYLDRAQPQTVVECGSGASTVLLADYADRTGALVVSLEHHPQHHANTVTLLQDRGLADRVDLRLAPLTNLSTPAGPVPWYAAELPEEIDFALVDGPPGAVGRRGALYALMPHMSDGAWEIWLDDADRPGERADLHAWRGHYLFRESRIATPRGMARLRSASVPPARAWIDASDIAVTLLTGGRPDLLAATVGSCLEHAPGLLETAHVAVLFNGGDPQTAALLAGWDFINHLTLFDQRLTVGQASSALLAYPAPRPYTLHLEDDWQVATTDLTWLDRARDALESDPRVGQVRLRHRGDTVLKTHMITRKQIWWEPAAHGTVKGTAHYTLNPSLMRSADTPLVWPASDERAAARTFYNQSWLTAQVVPGVFRHLGDGASLRLGQR